MTNMIDVNETLSTFGLYVEPLPAWQAEEIGFSLSQKKTLGFKVVDEYVARFGMSVGLVLHLIAAEKARRKAQVCAPALTQAGRIDKYIRENRIRRS